MDNNGAPRRSASLGGFHCHPACGPALSRVWLPVRERQLLLDEANAIGTTYLRAGMLPERGQQVRGPLREYVAARLEAVQPGKLAEGIRRSEDVQQQVWMEAETVGQKNPNSIVVGLFIQSLNQMIDLHAARMQVALRSRIPGAIWLGLFAVATLSLLRQWVTTPA